MKTCANCMNTIGNLEKSFDYQGSAVCKNCYEKLSTQNSATPKIEDLTPQIATYDKPKTLPRKILLNDEKIVFEKHPFFLFMFIKAMLLTFFAICTGYYFLMLSAENMGDSKPIEETLFLMIIIICPIVLLIVRLEWKTSIYGLTTKRILKFKGIISKNIYESPISRVQDIRLKKSILQRIFGCGTLIITTAGTAGEECKWVNLTKPEQTKNRIYSYLEKAGVFKVDVPNK